MLLAALSRLLPRPSWSDFFVTRRPSCAGTPNLIARTWTYPRKRPGRPFTRADVRAAVLRWRARTPPGDTRGSAASSRGRDRGTARYGTRHPQPSRPGSRTPRDGPTWGQFLKAQAARVWAGDNHDGLPACRYRDLLDHLSTLDRQAVIFAGRQIEKLTSLTPVQRRAFELLGTPVPSPSSSQYNKAARTRHGCSSQVRALTTSPRSSKFG